MFVIVKLSEETKGRRKRQKPDFFCERTDIDFHRCFFTVTVKTRKGRYDNNSLNRYVGNLKNSVIFPDSTYKENKKLSIRRLVNSAADILKSQKPLKRLCIYDTEGCCTDLIEKLLPLASSLHIICNNREIYINAAEELFYKYGASITVSQNRITPDDTADFVISPSLRDIPPAFKGKILTCDTEGYHRAYTYVAKGIELPLHLEKLRPVFTDKLLFATYLYEKCSVTEIESCPFENIDIRPL